MSLITNRELGNLLREELKMRQTICGIGIVVTLAVYGWSLWFLSRPVPNPELPYWVSRASVNPIGCYMVSSPIPQAFVRNSEGWIFPVGDDIGNATNCCFESMPNGGTCYLPAGDFELRTTLSVTGNLVGYGEQKTVLEIKR